MEADDNCAFMLIKALSKKKLLASGVDLPRGVHCEDLK